MKNKAGFRGITRPVIGPEGEFELQRKVITPKQNQINVSDFLYNCIAAQKNEHPYHKGNMYEHEDLFRM